MGPDQYPNGESDPISNADVGVNEGAKSVDTTIRKAGGYGIGLLDEGRF